MDEDTGAELRVTSASIVDPYLLLIRDDNSVYVAQIIKNELEEVERVDAKLTSTKWQAGCLYSDTKGVFQPSVGDKGADLGEHVMMFLLSASGALHVSLMQSL